MVIVVDLNHWFYFPADVLYDSERHMIIRNFSKTSIFMLMQM
jgi:chemotaxis signal transduction protein